jgi:hypothetical protein
MGAEKVPLLLSKQFPSCSSAEPFSVCRLRLETLLINPIEYFLANESQVRLDANVRDEAFLDVCVNRLYIDLEELFKLPGSKHFGDFFTSNRTGDRRYPQGFVSTDTSHFGGCRAGSWYLVPHFLF